MEMKEKKIVRRPGRKLGAERRRVARDILRRFYHTDEFYLLPTAVRLAILELCPEQDNERSIKTASDQKPVVKEQHHWISDFSAASSWR
ncbi:MAG: hypothetical protein ACOX6K_07500 [Sphaerochaetaceae bacterium]|jgi:hypothetical protein